MSPLAENYLGIPGYVIFWILFALALGLFIQRVYLLIRLLRLGKPENRFDRLLFRFTSMVAITFTQWCGIRSINQKDPAGIGHAFMFWGLILFLAGYVIFIGLGAGLGLFPVYNGNTFEITFFSILDIAALLVIAAMVWVIVKRYIIKPERLSRKESAAEKVIQPLLIAVIIGLMALHFCIEGFGYAAVGISGPWPPVGVALANSLAGSDISGDTLATVFRGLWWLNYIVLLAAMVYAPRSKHLHPLFSFSNIFFRNLAPKGSLRPIDLQKPETYKISQVKDFTWKELLDCYACTWCGLCHTVCPAQLSGKTLSPRELVLDLKEHLLEDGPGLLKDKETTSDNKVEAIPGDAVKDTGNEIVDKVIGEDAIWACTTCLACQEVCPSGNEQMVKIIDLRRHLQLGAMTETAREPLKNLRVRGHPWRGSMYARTDWAEGMDIKIIEEDSDVDVLFWAGCTGALEDRSLKVTQATAKLMKQAGVNFGILGEEEMCCGDPARRLGAEHLFQMEAMNNIQLFSSYNIRKIVTTCPHCFNILKNEYPRLGGQFEVIHHSQFIADLLKENMLKINRTTEAVVTYHDSCYLVRYNDIYMPPRQILQSIPGAILTEMEQNRKNCFCCGGGGGRMWLEEDTGQRISEIRLGHAIATRARLIATACPFCLQMFEDATKAKDAEESLKIRDIAELVLEASEVPDVPEDEARKFDQTENDNNNQKNTE
jgi:Fe-S oxidoreductase